MFEDLNKITDDEINEAGVCSAPDVLTGTPEENKKIFDRLCREVVIPALNRIIEEGKALGQYSKETNQWVSELENIINELKASLGDIESVNIKGDTLGEKINSLINSFAQSVTETTTRIGPMNSLKFSANSVVKALNYLYEYFSPLRIEPVSKLPTADYTNYMKLFRVFDTEKGKTKLFICKSHLPESTGLFFGQTAGRLYFDPYILKERFEAFREKYNGLFYPYGDSHSYMNVISFVNPSDESDKVYLQIKYFQLYDSYALAFSSSDRYEYIWASDNFNDLGVSHALGYKGEAYTNLFSGYMIKDIRSDINWLVNSKELNAEYYWEEFGASLSVASERNGRYTTLNIQAGDKLNTIVLEDGVNGYTPQKGQDYFTESDVEEIAAMVEQELKNDILASSGVVPVFASSEEECTDDSKLYVLPDGFIYQYLWKKNTEIINMATYGDGMLLNYRLSSTGLLKPYNGIIVTDYSDIDLVSPYIMKISGAELDSIYESPLMVTAYDEDKNWLGTAFKSKIDLFLLNGEYSVDLYEMIAEKYPTAKYVRLTLGIRNEALSAEDEDIKALFIEFVPKSSEEYVYELTNTNHAFVSADYSDVIKDIAENVSENSEDIFLLSEKVEKLEGEAYAYPSLWDGAIEDTVLKIQEKQREFGINGTSFAFFSDNHQRLGFAGPIIWEIMKRCSIPYAFYGGDAISNGIIASQEIMEEQEKLFSDMMKCIPADRLCRALGNHDGYYFLSTGERYHCSWEEIYSIFMSKGAVSQNKNFGGDGTYYYVDDVASKTRFIVLNSVWFDYKENEDGTLNNQDGFGFGAKQINWLCDILTSNPEGFDVVFFSHSPVSNNGHSNIRDAYLVQGIVNAFISGGEYNGEYTGSVNSLNDASVAVCFEKKGNVIGWFSGHIHADTINTEDAQNKNSLLFKTVTITSDANMSYDETEATRDMSGDTSHAIDFVTVNKNTGEVYIFRLGIGEDRTYNYLEE